jgi:response regulator RpfG family c-di-GMP phosphodiesterase
MKPLLAFEGFTTITTSNPREGLKILENDDSIDIVVLDWMMPGFSGIDFLKGKKELGDERAVLMLTALGDQKNVQEALMNGAKDYVVKPIDNKVFVKKINNILGLNSGKKHERNDPRKTMVQNIKTPIVIEDIGRDNISLRSLFPLNIGDTIMLESEALTQRLDIERKKRLPIKVLKHKGSANDYLIKGEFFGLTNTVRQKIVNAYETGMLL